MVLFTLFILFVIGKGKIIVQVNYNSIDEHILYCDDYINFYGTSNLNVYKILENGNINVNSQLKLKYYEGSNTPHYLCNKYIVYKTNSLNEKLLIEFNAPKDFRLFFCNSTATFIEIKSGNFDNYKDYTLTFANNKNLISLDLSNFGMKNVEIFDGIFEFDINLEKIIWPINPKTGVIKQSCTMFYQCSKLTSIDISFFDFSKVTIMHATFADCYNLEKIIFPNKTKISLIEDFSYVFWNCNKITSIDLSNFEFSSIFDMRYLFYNCRNLNTIIWPKENITFFSYNTRSFSYMFYNCSSLISIDLSKFYYFNGITDLSYMFSNCNNLKFIKLSGYLDWQAAPVNVYFYSSHAYMAIKTTINNMFLNCTSIKILNLLTININFNTELLPNISILEGCLFHEYNSDMIKCSKYMGFFYCGECSNNNKNEYCSKKILGENYNFFFFGQTRLSDEKKQCFWSNNYSNFEEYEFINNINDKNYYYDYFCHRWCETCSKDKSGCIKCKNNFYPVNNDYNNYLNKLNNSFNCYEVKDMKNYYLDLVNSQFIKCNEKCKECKWGVDYCSICNDGYYSIEDQEYNCSKTAPGDNYALDFITNQWRKCDKRCKKCYKQTRSKIDHQCLKCNDNYYPYKMDYDNYVNKKLNITGFNCYTFLEVKNDNINYYLSSNYFFEKCDNSCIECEYESNFCKICNLDYYNILGENKSICYKNPKEGYGLIYFEGQFFLKKCFHLCKFCTEITESFLYQQCKECDEVNYTLDLFSYKKSFCIPKDKSKSSFIQKQSKWYIEFELENTTIFDFEKFLNNISYKDIKYKEVDNCPSNKPYIIYSIRQCVSSCNSKNLIEFGIFMTKKLYFYNNICYDSCPYGSIEDDINNTCIEINLNTTTNNNISIYFYEENYQEYIINYLSKYANNSVSIMRNYDFSNYFYNKTTNESFKIQLKMPIFDFTECLKVLKNESHLDNQTDIFIGIIEYNSDINSKPIKSTNYKFFINDGKVLNYSNCSNINITVRKIVDTQKLNEDIDVIEEIKNKYNLSSLFNNESEFNNYCLPLSLNKKDLTLYDRQFLVQKIIKPCDDNCKFIDFNFSTNYSTCICPITLPDNKKIIENKIREKSEIFENLYKLKDEGNWKYLKCFGILLKFNNWIFFIIYCLFFVIGEILYMFYYIYNYDKRKQNKNIQISNELKYNDKYKIKKGSNSERSGVIIYNKKKSKQNRNCMRNLCEIFFGNFKEEFLCGFNKFNLILVIFMHLHTYSFFNAFLFSDKYISVRYSYKGNINLIYIITDEFSRILIVIIFSYLVLLIFKSLLNLTKDSKKIIIIFLIIIILIHLFYFYFIHIFTNINLNSINDLLLSEILSLFLYFIFKVFITFIKSCLNLCLQKCKNETVCEIINKITELL